MGGEAQSVLKGTGATPGNTHSTGPVDALLLMPSSPGDHSGEGLYGDHTWLCSEEHLVPGKEPRMDTH